jgi:hypothetical protein
MSVYKFNWKIYLIFMLAIVPLSLMLVHQLIVKSVLPWSITSQYIYLFYAHPNVFSMYFSNFAHVPNDHGVHLFTNISVWFFVIAMIAAVYIFIAPKAKYEISEKINPVDPVILSRCTLIYFTVVPFMVSAASIVAAQTLDPTALVGYGFSGIIFAFGGYLAYLCLDLSEKKITSTRKMRFSDKAIAFMIPGSFLLAIVADAMTFQGSNAVGHLTGFVIGYISPWILDNFVYRWDSFSSEEYFGDI